MLVASVVSDFETPGTIACLAPLPNATLQTRILEWVAVPFSRGSSQLRDRTWVTHNVGRFFTVRATREAQNKVKGVHFQVSSVAQSCPALCDPMDFSMPGFPVHRQLLELTQTYAYRVGDAIQPSHPLSWPKYWNFSFSISPSNEHPGLISFRMDWLDLLAVHGSLKSLLQHHSSKVSILPHSAFFIVQLSHPYMTAGKTISLTKWTFVGKVMSLLLNMLSMLVVAFLSGNKWLLISWLQSPSAVILEALKILDVWPVGWRILLERGHDLD